MIVSSLFVLLSLIGSIKSTSTGLRNNVFLTGSETQDTVLAISKGYGYFVVGTKSRIKFFTDEELRKFVGEVNLRFVHRSKFLELKILSKSEVFYCDTVECGLCTYSGKSSSCSKIVDPDSEIKEIKSAVVVKIENSELLMLRISFIDTSDNEKAMIFQFKAQDNGICASDQSEQLASKMTIPLSCDVESSDDNYLNNDNLNSTAQAAQYDIDKGYLTVVLRRDRSREYLVCGFQMSLIEKRFDSNWNICQETSLSSSEAGPVLKNCDLHMATGKNYLYGWLEDYRPLMGELLIRIKENNHIDRISSIVDDGPAYFVTLSKDLSPRLVRISAAKNSLVQFHYEKPMQKSDKFSILKMSNILPIRVLYIENEEIRILAATCRDMYSSCENLKFGGWSDPLQCAWCTDTEPFHVISQQERSQCSSYLTHFCPPDVNEIKVMKFTNGSGFTLYGNRFAGIENPRIIACDAPCDIHLFEDSRVNCFIKKGHDVSNDCNELSLTGDMGPNKDYTLSFEYKDDKDTQTDLAGLGVMRSSESVSSRSWKAAVAVLSVIFIIFVVALIVYFMRNRMSRIKAHVRKPNGLSKVENDYALEHLPGRISNVHAAENYVNIFSAYPKDIKIDFKNIKIDTMRELGHGNFGVVYAGIYKCLDGRKQAVACKYMKEGSIREFYEEARIMTNFNHPHVLKLIGIALDDKTLAPVAITELMQNGDLQSYIQDVDHHITLRMLLRFAIEIAQGMEHIHEKGFVHRDLATRNCMLDDNFSVKIADFGLCRPLNEGTHLYEPNNMFRNLPIKWMPPEIEHQLFGYSTDVWSYGVLLWELFTRGNIPYANIETGHLLTYLQQGHRMSKPQYCPDKLYNEAILECWQADPQSRPSFTQLVGLRCYFEANEKSVRNVTLYCPMKMTMNILPDL
ncbi:unnamed protein product [Caenorhabditis bovis]|uniref:receptor protein-tyrosine kinase n=1 Tax=Caenorhabditis bovis TaxID=2654633 RepID=A0A8S1EK88_9PELO|nr:unnamed protein product [Caenorhabditis bovis]